MKKIVLSALLRPSKEGVAAKVCRVPRYKRFKHGAFTERSIASEKPFGNECVGLT